MSDDKVVIKALDRQLEEQQAEIERLLVEIINLQRYGKKREAEAIEECAQVAERIDSEALHCVGGHDRCDDGPFDGCPYCENRSPVAAAIRALKEKP